MPKMYQPRKYSETHPNSTPNVMKIRKKFPKNALTSTLKILGFRMVPFNV